MSRFDLSFDPDMKPEKPNKDKEKIEVVDEKKGWLSYLQLPKREVNQKYPFYFHTYDPKIDGTIFIITALLIPLIALFIFHFILGMGGNNPLMHTPYPDGWQNTKNFDKSAYDYSTMIYLLVTIVSNIIGFVIFWQRDKELFIKSGFIVFYSFIFITNIISFIVGMILGFSVSGVGTQERTEIIQIVSIWAQVVAEIIVIYLAFKMTSNLGKRILMTLKQNWLMLIIVACIAGGLLFAFSSPVYTAIFSGVKDSAGNKVMVGSSTNQKTLTDALKSGTTGFKVGYLISLFVLTILIAPLTEELATRNALFVGVGNKTLAIIVSVVYFGMLHVQAGDVEHIVTYLIGGIFLAGVFAISRGNVIYDTSTHIIYNLISYIIIVVQVAKGTIQ